MTQTAHPHPSILFTVRLWSEEVAANQFEWRGEVKKLADGQTRYFRDWPTLVNWIGQMLEEEPQMNEPSTPREAASGGMSS